MFEIIKESSISSFRNSRSILKLESERLVLWVFGDWKCHIDLKSLRLEFHTKKIFPYSGVFKPYSDVLKPYSGVFPQKKKKFKWSPHIRFREPYSGVFNPYSDVFKPYSSVFLQFMEIESLKLDFHMDFFPHQTHPLTNWDLKTRVLSWNSSFRHSRC